MAGEFVRNTETHSDWSRRFPVVLPVFPQKQVVLRQLFPGTHDLAQSGGKFVQPPGDAGGPEGVAGVMGRLQQQGPGRQNQAPVEAHGPQQLPGHQVAAGVARGHHPGHVLGPQVLLDHQAGPSG